MGESLFEEEFTMEALSQMGNPLERLSSLVDFEMFRPVLEDVLLTKECKTHAGRKPIDVVLMFKVIFLQRYYGLGNHQIQYQIIDRTSFRQFLGIHTVAEIPDEKTVWACRDKLSKAGTFDLLFDQFREYLDSLGLSFNEGKIIDATFVEAPRQRNTREENKQIKDGKGADLWQAEEGDSEKEKARKAHKRSHKDIDASWTKKRGENHPLTDEQKKSNCEKSHSRCLIEHIFGFVEGAMNGSLVRSIGMIRAKASTALTCLVYNIFRYEQLCRCQPALVKKALANIQG